MGWVLARLVVVVVAAAVSKAGGYVEKEPPVVRTPHHLFKRLPELGYPWAPHYLLQRVECHSLPLRAHYIDEGPRDAPETLLLLHGTPAWSFLYRRVVPGLLDAGYRVVALDQIGFGRSDKLTNPEAYSHELHVATVLLLLEKLDLKGVTLFGQDLGGPTGVSAMARAPHRFRRVVLLNTWLPQGDVFSSLSRVWEHAAYLGWRNVVAALGRHQPVETVMKVATDASSDVISGGYGAPYPSSQYKAGPAWWPLMIPLTEDDPVAIEMHKAATFLSTWHGPALLGYSDREVFTLPGRALLQRVLPQACQVEIEDAGHFLQEEQGPLIARLVVAFIEEDCGAVLRTLASNSHQ